MSHTTDQSHSTSVDLPLVLDHGTLDTFTNDICGGDLDTIMDLVEVYLQSLDELTRQMSSALDAGDYPVLRRAAHSLKSSSRVFGAEALAKNCEQLEKAALSGEVANAPALIQRIVKQSQQMRRLLVAEFDGNNHEP